MRVRCALWSPWRSSRCPQWPDFAPTCSFPPPEASFFSSRCSVLRFSSRPALRQILPTATLGAVAAAGRILFAPVPDVKPVSAIAIVAGATLGRQSGFMVGAISALVSNFFFGQGAWTPMQMYAWGLVGYLAGVLADVGAFRRGWVLYAYGAASGLLYGLLLNGWYVLGYVRPLTWQTVLAAFALGLPLDATHSAATVGFLAAIWLPWRRAIRRVVAKYGLR